MSSKARRTRPNPYLQAREAAMADMQATKTLMQFIEENFMIDEEEHEHKPISHPQTTEPQTTKQEQLGQ